ncbi:MAG: hypothetical protein AAB663_01250 [Patescibacteria group bacterium]
MQGLWLALSFILASIIATTAIPSLPEPFVFLPIMLAGGIVVMNRIGVVQGTLWLVLSSVVLATAGTSSGRVVTTLIATAVGVVLAERVFAKRSVYALLGLGATTGAVYVVLGLAHRVVARMLDDVSAVGMNVREAWWTWLLLMFSVYAAFVVAVAVTQWLGKRFLVRE